MELNEKQGTELCDNVEKMLATELNSEAIRMEVKRVVADYVNKRDIADDPELLLKKLEWLVKVKFRRYKHRFFFGFLGLVFFMLFCKEGFPIA
jgi:hypothetical protein